MKVAVITGTARGIGKTLKDTFENAGYRVIGVDKVVHQGFLADLANRDGLESFIHYVKKETTHINCLINNACYSKGGLDSCDYDAFNEVLRVGVSAPFYLTQQLRPIFSENMCIINIASTRAFQSQCDTESYSAAKGAISALTHAMAISLTGEARVNAISPGWIDHEMAAQSEEDFKQHPVGRVGRAIDVANMALFLADEANGFITGENITIDGGMSKLMIYHKDEGWEYKINKKN